MREKPLIESIRRLAAGARGGADRARAGGPGRLRLRQGIGDDCAVLSLPKRQQQGSAGRGAFDLLVTTDLSLESVHFRRDWHLAEAVGHRCLARGLSDIAAMGGEPEAAFLSLALPGGLPPRWVERFLKGLLKLAEGHGVRLAGGDVSRSPGGVLADIVVLGSVPAGAGLLRSGAKPGDLIYVTGTLGGAEAALQRLRARKGGGQQAARTTPAWAMPHLFPRPRVEVGRGLRKLGASACIDLSDGLSSDLGHICGASGAGAVIYEASLPLFTEERPQPQLSRHQALDLALHGGEDYELLFTAAPGARVPRRIAGVRVTRVGEMVSGKKVWVQDARGKRRALKAGGWEHVIG